MALLSALYQEISARQAHNRDLTLIEFLTDIETLKEHGTRLTFAARLPKEKSVSVMLGTKQTMRRGTAGKTTVREISSRNSIM